MYENKVKKEICWREELPFERGGGALWRRSMNLG
ncbi:MAG: hypothetical protein RIS70_2025, partial [Planctomycetota bacterium]